MGIISILGLYLYIEPDLPSIDGLSDVQLQVPLRVYSKEGALIAEYGEKRRSPKDISEIPVALRQAFLAAEDDRFYEHPGVDYQGILRAVVHLLKTGRRGQGGSTITMQLARNFYLSREKTFTRKFNEIFLALKIEGQLPKDKILELYLNKIYLGNRAYGVAAAAQVYYGKTLEQLDLAQIAMIAGLPKAPSRYNPIINPDRALTRRNYVLNRMAELGHISETELRWAKAQSITAGLHDSPVDLSASYVAEMVRAEISRQFDEEAYTRGLRVYTTIEKGLQEAANQSVRQVLLDYDQRHGYRGPEKHIELKRDELETAENTEISTEQLAVPDPGLQPALESTNEVGAVMEGEPSAEVKEEPTEEEIWEQALDGINEYGGLYPALVIELGEQEARVYMRGGRLIQLDWESMSWAKAYIDVNTQGAAPEVAADVLKLGDVVRIYRNADGLWHLGQLPEVQGALTSLDPNDGAIKALVGGFDFHHSKFNRAVQAKRQAGSSFKPFIYSAALEKRYTAATMINDAPVVFHDPALEGTWRPENYSGKFYGPTRLREALVKSRNLVSIRILRSIGIGYATRFAGRFGFDRKLLPHDLSLALGSGEVSPLELSAGFAVFANGGYRIMPYFVQRIEDMNGNVLYEADPEVACVSCVLKARGQDMPLPDVKIIENNILVDEVEQAVLAPMDTIASEALAEDLMTATLAKLPKQAERAVDERVIYIMNSILQDVIRRGTGRRALALGRNDLHGKTGTTNDQKDAWFNGFNRSLVATVWVGFDQQQRSLGNYETGSKAALPMWVEYMRTALKGVPESMMDRPDNLVTVKINSETGELAGADDVGTIFEIFRAERAPEQKSVSGNVSPGSNSDESEVMPEQLF
ncbi:MAG: penicillin-binding protein 1A [Gammaproteobacteria bacterium]